MKHRRILSLVLTLVMIASLFTFPVASADTAAWDGETVTQPAGKGTREEPFLIATAENLAWISHMVKNYDDLNDSGLIESKQYKSHNVFEGVYFIQTADIDLGGKKFTPIGNKQSSVEARRIAFAGSYDGRSYKISNAVIHPEGATLRETDYKTFMSTGFRPGGLFGVITAQASIRNVNACNVKVGSLNTNHKNNIQAYDTLIAGVIVGTTNGNALISGCTVDADCEAYGLVAAGGILGMAENGGDVKDCVNSAKIGSDMAAGGIVGCGYNVTVSHCLNQGTTTLYATARWAAAGGIMGKPYALSGATVVISDCVNGADAKTEVVSLQPADTSSNRIALGGIMGHDGQASQVDVSYLNCFNLQTVFSAKFIDNGNTASGNFLSMAGGIIGNTKDVVGAGSRTMEHCFSVAANLTEDIPDVGASTYACNFNQQADRLNPSPYAGLIGAALSDLQIGRAWGENIAKCFETCAYGISAEELTAKAAYQETVAIAETVLAYKDAPKYVGVQETLDKTSGNYALRFLAGIDAGEYYEAGVEVTAAYGDGQVAYYKLVADKYHDSLSGKKADGKGVNYTAASLGADKVMALTQTIDLEAFGAVTYTVTPFSVKAQGDDTLYGRAWELRYNADGSFAGHNIVAAASEADVTANYTIVYPDDSVNATVYPVVSLQYLVLSKRGIKLPLANEQSADPDAYEIVIAEDALMADGAYKTEVRGNRLIVTAGDMFGFIAASNRLTKQLFASGSIKLSESCNTEGVYDREMLNEKQAETRVIFQNAWFREDVKQFTQSVTNYEYQLALVMNYLPDVIGLNEFREGWRASGFIGAMAENGYVEVQSANYITGKVGLIDNPIFYNSATTEYIEGSAIYVHYGNLARAHDVDGDGVGEAALRNTGEFAGRYYDDADSLVRTAAFATFRDKATGQVYTVCNTHFESNGGVDPQVGPLGNPLRWEQVEKLLNYLDDYVATYNAPVLLGGDYNSHTSYEERTYTAKGGSISFTNEDLFTFHDGRQIPYLYGAYEMLLDAGFYDMKTKTSNTALNNSTQGYPVWNEELKAFVAHTATLDGTSGGGIDHALAFDPEGKIDTVVYRYLEPETILTSSDHKPVMIDFNLTDGNSGTEESFDDNDLEGETWQGMNDYAAPTNGSGTEEDPYLIERPEHLAWLALATNNTGRANAFLGTDDQQSRRVFAGVYFKQTADIDLAGLAFTPIGNYQSSPDYLARRGFGGVYDGNGFAIKNATINACLDNGQTATEGFATNTYVSGIFGLLAASSVVTDVHAKNIKVGTLLDANATTSAETYGETFAGVIVGIALDCTVTNCTTDADCEAIGVYAGGIVAFQSTCRDLSYCVNRATVTGDKAAGGIVGAGESAVISYNVNYADIALITFDRWSGAGGIIGAYSAKSATTENAVSNCINYGAMSAIDRNATVTSNHRVGIGGIIGNDNPATNASYENCFNLASEFTASVVHTELPDNFIACAAGIVGYAKIFESARSYTNCYSVAGVVDTDYFGTPKNDFAWNWSGMNSTQGVNESPYAGIITGVHNDNQVNLSIKNATKNTIETAFATCHYGVTAAEIEANETYQAILAALAD